MDTLRLYLVTWNVACKPPEENLNALLGLDEQSPHPDIYVIALQEVKSQPQNIVLDALFNDPWTTTLRTKLKVRNYVKLKTVRLQGIILSLFALKHRILHIRGLQAQYVKTGLGGLWGNKGAVALRLNIKGVSICFVNSHMTPHDENLEARIMDYTNILREMTFPKQPETTRILYHDYVFWLGDHNFRIDKNIGHEEILSRIQNNDLKWLLSHDQLKTVMKNGEAFSELIEPSIDFLPTFKFHFHSNDYDNKRRPAWTDRILYKVTANAYDDIALSVNLKNYTSLPQYSQSDHKPVIADYGIKIRETQGRVRRSDQVDYPPSDSVQFEPIDNWLIDKPNTIVVKPGNDVVVSDFDWIGLFPDNFSSLEDYTSYLYINPRRAMSEDDESRRVDRNRIELTFHESVLQRPGKFVLLYLTQDSEDVLGISTSFNAVFSQPGSESPNNAAVNSTDAYF